MLAGKREPWPETKRKVAKVLALAWGQRVVLSIKRITERSGVSYDRTYEIFHEMEKEFEVRIIKTGRGKQCGLTSYAMLRVCQTGILEYEKDVAPFYVRWKDRILIGTDPANVLSADPSAVRMLWPEIEENLDDYMGLTLRAPTSSLVRVHEKDDEWFMMKFHRLEEQEQDPHVSAMDDLFLWARQLVLFRGLTPPHKEAVDALSVRERGAVLEWLRGVEGPLDAYASLAAMAKRTIDMLAG